MCGSWIPMTCWPMARWPRSRRRLARDRPDVLLIDYLILGPSGQTRPSPGAALLAAPAGAAARRRSRWRNGRP